MSSTRVCPNCGASNPSTNQFCSCCNSPLPVTATTPTPTSSQPVYPWGIPQSQYNTTPAGYAAQYSEQDQNKQIGRAKNGLLLLAVGILLGPIPYIGSVGVLLAFIGYILVIIGRRVFGEKHSKYTIWSLIIYVAGTIILVGIVTSIVFSLFLAGTTSGASASTLASQFEQFLLVGVMAGAVIGIANVLFTYALQRPLGRYLLWLGYGASILVSIAVGLIIEPDITQAVKDSLSGGTFNPAPFDSLQAKQQSLTIIQMIPGVIYAAAYYLASDRIRKGEIPESSVPTSSVNGPAWPRRP